jgi:Fe-S cluster assembly iron-binding protein IscA
MRCHLKVALAFVLTALIFPAIAFASVSVSLSPATAQLHAGGQVQLNAVVSGTSNSVVVWSLTGVNCIAITCGQITNTGLYTAPATPPSPDVVTITATSLQDLSRSASSAVIVGNSSDVKVSVSPAASTVLAGQQQQFVSSVSGTTITGVNWHLSGVSCGGSGCGTITGGGVYTAPATSPTPAQVMVTATSIADPSKTASAVVTTASPVSINTSPKSVRLNTGLQTQFTATVTNTTNTAVRWAIAGNGCSGASCGTISPGGLYTAPASVPSPPQVYVAAESLADPTKTSTATVTVIPPVAVSIAPTNVQILVGGHQQFTATVMNTTNTAVNWSVAGSGCSGASCGSVSSSGLYTAPATVPTPAQIFVTATSVVDPTKSSTASATISLPVGVTVSPATATVALGGHQQFTATVANTTNTGVTWSVAGSGCSGAACGTITAAGLYNAPTSVPSPAQVTVTATSIADPTRSGSATVTIAVGVSINISPTTVTLTAGAQKQFTATVTNTSNTAVTWNIAGDGCGGASCGTITAAGLYTAPASVPSPPQVFVAARSVADPTKTSTATVTIAPPVSVTVSPTTAQLITGTKQQFTATVKNTANTAVTWSLSGSCSGTACGTITSAGLYTAPSAVPNPALISVIARSVADPTKSATAAVTILPPVGVTISPTTATVPTGGRQQFLVTVSGTNNNNVTWSVTGSGCTGSACGVVSPSGRYTAPTTAPNPAKVTVTVTSAGDSTKFATATVTIVPPVAVKISPTAVELATGNTQRFTATVTGATNTNVTWSLSGTGCTGATCGIISSSGLYTAPGTVPSPPNVTVTATSAADSTKSASATVTVIPPVAVSVSPVKVQVVTGNQQQFIATVTGSQNTGVTWSLSGSGCSGSACGTINSTGLYTAPAKVPNPAQVKVTAKSDADSTKSGSATVTVIAPVTVRISPTNATVAVNGEQQFQAAVTGSTNTAVAWSVSGAGCSGSGCGTISSTGLYQAPSSLPSPATVIVKASARIDVAASASTTVNIVANLNSKLNGEYAFQFTGFDSNGIYQATGSFTADGAGTITSGLEDVNTTNGVNTGFAISGTYNLTGDGRGLLTLSTASGTQVFSFALNIAGTRARFIEFDASGIRGSGEFEQQDPSAFSVSALKGAYVLRLAGKNSTGARIGALGLLYFDGSGAIIGGTLDVNDGGTVLPTFASFKGIYRVDNTGRGIMNLTIPGFGDGVSQFAFYVVSAAKLRFISTDQLSANSPIFSGPAELQSVGPFSGSIMSGPTVFHLAGEQANVPQVIVGRIVFDGVSQAQVNLDQNTGGTVTTGSVATSGYAVEVNGRGALYPNNSSGPGRVWDIYIIGPNHAFMMDASSADVGMGELTPQMAEPHFSSADILGTYLLGSGDPLVPTATLDSGVVSFDGKSAMSGTEDISFSTGLAAGKSVAGTYSVSSSLNNGRGTLVLTSPSGETIALWIAGDNEVIGVETDSSNAQPVVLHFEQ